MILKDDEIIIFEKTIEGLQIKIYEWELKGYEQIGIPLLSIKINEETDKNEINYCATLRNKS